MGVDVDFTPAVAETPGLLDGLRTGRWLDDQLFEPLRFAVPGLVPEGMTLLIGPPKAGKSWLVLGLCLAVATGGRALGTLAVDGPRPVLLLALEDGDRRLQDRCRELLHGDPIPDHLHYLTKTVPGRVADTIEAWLEVNGDREPLVVLDTLGRSMPPALPGESAYGRDYRVASTLKRVIDSHPGASLVVLHHDRKAAATDFVDAVSGTNGLAGAADTIVVLARERHASDGLLKVTGRDVEESEYAVTVQAGTWQLAGGSLAEAAEQAATVKATENLGDRSAEVVKFFGSHPGGVRAAEVAATLNVDGDTARRYLARLHDAGRIEKPSRGLYTPVPSVPSVPSSGTHPSQQDTRDRRDTGTEARCTVCAFPLNHVLAAAGETTHPTCSELP